MLGEADCAAIRHLHCIGEKTEVGLVHVEHLLHGAAGDADLLADDALTKGFAALQETQGNSVGLIQADGRVTLGQRGKCFAATQGIEQLIAQGGDQGSIHGGFALCKE
ncbi:hypothetical protein D3C79_938600 [compost metagenome]